MANFQTLQQAVIRLYNAGEYEQALKLMNQEAPNYPDRADDLYLYRANMAACLADVELALQFLEEGIARGYWYPADLIAQDDDFKLLFDNPRFKEVLRVCTERKAEAQKHVRPVRIVREPSHAEQPYPYLLALHGNGNNAEGTIDHYAPAVERGWLVVAAQSTQLAGPRGFIWNDQAIALRDVKEYDAEVRAAYPVDPDRAVVAGFSMGGGTAIRMALGGALDVRGFFCLGPWLPEPEELRPLLAGAKARGLRGYIVCGADDAGCLKASQAVQAMMQEAGMACELELYPGLGHEYPSPDTYGRSLAAGLTFITGK